MHPTPPPILPGATIGVLGSGQLGRMFTIAARRMGYRVHTFSPDTDTPTGQVADVEVVADYDDLDAVADFARHVSVVTFEFENVPTATAEMAQRHALVRPAGDVLHTTQHRLREKAFLSSHGFPLPRYAPVESGSDLKAAVGRLGLPAVLKSASFGYDGKGQSTLRTQQDVQDASAALVDGQQYVLETMIDFERELSVVAARGGDGAFAHWGLIENHHLHHILDVSIAPCDVPAKVVQRAVEIARGVLEALDVVGVLCVEFFLKRDHELLVNELAPRPHNSGHLTIDACITSQFEQQLRAVCGLPLGKTDLIMPAAMANLLGDLWEPGEPDWATALAHPGIKLHLYGKAEPRHGRKMGHLTVVAPTAGEAEQAVLSARQALLSRIALTAEKRPDLVTH